MTGKLLSEGQALGPKYWQDNLESPVLFKEATKEILHHEIGKNAVWLEIGPHLALAGPLRQAFTQVASPTPYVLAINCSQNCVTAFLTAI